MADTLKQSLIDAHDAVAEKGGQVSQTGAKYLAEQIRTIPSSSKLKPAPTLALKAQRYNGHENSLTIIAGESTGSEAVPEEAEDIELFPGMFRLINPQTGEVLAETSDIDWEEPYALPLCRLS